MTNSAHNNDSILIRSLGMDNRKEAVFRMAFKMFTRRHYQLLEANDARQPTLTIVDIDGPDGKNLAQKLHQDDPTQRILVTSVAVHPDCIFPILQKPVRMETLFPALETLLLAAPVAQEKPVTNVMPIRPEVPVSGTNPGIQNSPPQIAIATKPDESATAAVAPAPSKPAPILHSETVQYFNPEEGLLALLQIVQRDQAAAIITDNNQQAILRLDPVADQAILMVSDEQLQNYSRTAQPGLQMRALRDQDTAGSDNFRHISLQSLLWQTGAWTANGRLSRKLQPHAPVQLKQWPNLTRLPMLPDALRLAAFLSRSPAPPTLIVKMLRIEPRDLFNFLAAADSLGLLRYNTPENPEYIVRASQQTPTETEIPTARRNFLGRLLKRIAGL